MNVYRLSADSNEFLSKSRRARSTISSFRTVLPTCYTDMLE